MQGGLSSASVWPEYWLFSVFNEEIWVGHCWVRCCTSSSPHVAAPSCPQHSDALSAPGNKSQQQIQLLTHSFSTAESEFLLGIFFFSFKQPFDAWFSTSGGTACVNPSSYPVTPCPPAPPSHLPVQRRAPGKDTWSSLAKAVQEGNEKRSQY